MRAHPDPVQEAKGPHQQNCAQRALLLPTTKGGHHGIRQGYDRPGSFQPLRELDIFHERDIGEASDALEDVAPHEDGLVAGGNAAEAGSHIHQAGDHARREAGRVKPHVESPADASLVGQGLRNGLPGIRRKLRIGVQEQEDVATGGNRPCIELACASGRRRHEANGGSGCRCRVVLGGRANGADE